MGILNRLDLGAGKRCQKPLHCASPVLPSNCKGLRAGHCALPELKRHNKNIVNTEDNDKQGGNRCCKSFAGSELRACLQGAPLQTNGQALSDNWRGKRRVMCEEGARKDVRPVHHHRLKAGNILELAAVDGAQKPVRQYGARRGDVPSTGRHGPCAG